MPVSYATERIPFVRSFLWCFPLRYGSICAVIATWIFASLRLYVKLQALTSSPNLLPFNVNMDEELTAFMLIYLNFSNNSHPFDYVADVSYRGQNIVDTGWLLAGVLVGCLLLAGVCLEQRSWMLPWLSWSCVHFLLCMVNLVITCAQAISFGYAVAYGFVKHLGYIYAINFGALPLQLYFVLIVISHYQILETRCTGLIRRCERTKPATPSEVEKLLLQVLLRLATAVIIIFVMTSKEELACIYSALILQDDDITITAEKISSVLKAANIEVESYWPSMFAKALEGVNVKELIFNIAGAAPSAAQAGAPLAAAAATTEAAAATTTTKAEEKKKEEKEESEDEDMGLDLFG